MKVGDKEPVIIAGQVVGYADISEIADGTATLVIPATRVVMGVRTSLTQDTAPVDTTGTETIITGVDRVPATPPVADEQTLEAPSGEAPIVSPSAEAAAPVESVPVESDG